MRIGLALGGGGARGIFHLGVLQGLEKLNIKPDVLAGTSMGALIAGLYSVYGSAAAAQDKFFSVFNRYHKDISALKSFMNVSNLTNPSLKDKALDFLRGFYIWNLYIIKPSLIQAKPFVRLFKEMFDGCGFEHCRIPLYITSVDLNRGEVCVINEGMPLHRAVLASSALPGVFPPVKWLDKLLVDGGVLLPVPISVIKDNQTFAIGVNLEKNLDIHSARNASEVLVLTDTIRYKKILDDNLALADFLFTPDLNNVFWSDFYRAKELVKLGYEFILANAELLNKRLKRFRLRKLFIVR